MSTARFYIPTHQWNPEALILREEEARHCRDVLRHEVGDKLVVFNGSGVEATARIAGLEKDAIRLETQSILKANPLTVRITLAQAVIKGKAMDLVLQKATELGAARIVPLLSDRSVVRLDAKEAGRKRDKWQRIVIEACKQSGQNWLPEVAPCLAADRFFDSPHEEDLCLLASLGPGARSLHEIVAEYADMLGRRPTSALVVIGPEGDFTPAEMATAQRAGCLPWSLGPIVLRSETAALHALSITGYELGRL